MWCRHERGFSSIAFGDAESRSVARVLTLVSLIGSQYLEACGLCFSSWRHGDAAEGPSSYMTFSSGRSGNVASWLTIKKVVTSHFTHYVTSALLLSGLRRGWMHYMYILHTSWWNAPEMFRHVTIYEFMMPKIFWYFSMISFVQLYVLKCTGYAISNDRVMCE